MIKCRLSESAVVRHEFEMCSSSTYCFGKDTHELRELMCEHGQHGSERAKACCEEDEEWKLFLWVHRHLVECWGKSQRKQGKSQLEQIKKKRDVGFRRGLYTITVGAIMLSNALHLGYCTYRAVVPCLLFLCILGRGKTGDPSLVGRELSGRL